MKFSDKYFKFPVRLYLAKDLGKRDELSERLGIELPEEDDENIPNVIGWEVVLIDDISGYGTLFSRSRTMEEVELEGFDCTLVCLRSGKEVGCSWSPEEFEKQLNRHAEWLREMEQEMLTQRIKHQAEVIREEIQVNLGQVQISIPNPKKKWWQFWK